MQQTKLPSRYVKSARRDVSVAGFKERLSQCPPLFALGGGLVGGVLLALWWLPTQAVTSSPKDLINSSATDPVAAVSVLPERLKRSPFELVDSLDEPRVDAGSSAQSSAYQSFTGSIANALPEVFILGISGSGSASDELAAGFSTLASADDASLGKWYGNLLAMDIERPEHHMALSALLHDWALSDSRFAVEELIQSIHSSRSEFDLAARKQLLDSLVSDLPQGQEILFSQIESHSLSEMQLSAVQLTLMTTEPDRADAIADHLVQVNGARASEQFISDWIYADAKAALFWLESSAGQAMPDDLREQAVTALAEQDPLAVLAWVETVGDGRGRLAAIEYALGTMLETDPAAVRDYIDSLPDTREGRELANNLAFSVASEYGNEDPLAALSWAQQKDPALAETLVETVLVEWYTQDPASARSWAEANLALDAHAEVIERGLSRQLIGDPQAAEQAYFEMDLYTRLGHAAMFGEQLELEYPGAGEEWLHTITDPVEKGQAQLGIIQAMVAVDPVSAIDMSLNFEQQQQTEALMNIVQIHGDERPQLVQQILNDYRIEQTTREAIQQWYYDNEQG